MLIQVLVGPTEYETEYENAIRHALFVQGYEIKLVPVDIFIDNLELNSLLKMLSRKAFATIVLSGLRWDRIIRQVSTYLLPNAIVVTSNPALQYAWEIKPVIVINHDKSFIDNILSSINTLSIQKIDYPARSISFNRTEFGWRRRSIMEEPRAVKAWDAIMEHVWPGYKFSTWSAYRGDLGGGFEIEKITRDSVTIRSPNAINLQVIPKKDFFRLAINWTDYKSGKIPRHELRDMTRYSTYIIGILYWLDNEGHLN